MLLAVMRPYLPIYTETKSESAQLGYNRKSTGLHWHDSWGVVRPSNIKGHMWMCIENVTVRADVDKIFTRTRVWVKSNLI